jgi:hypothetical protein
LKKEFKKNKNNMKKIFRGYVVERSLVSALSNLLNGARSLNAHIDDFLPNRDVSPYLIQGKIILPDGSELSEGDFYIAGVREGNRNNLRARITEGTRFIPKSKKPCRAFGEIFFFPENEEIDRKKYIISSITYHPSIVPIFLLSYTFITERPFISEKESQQLDKENQQFMDALKSAKPNQKAGLDELIYGLAENPADTRLAEEIKLRLAKGEVTSAYAEKIKEFLDSLKTADCRTIGLHAQEINALLIDNFEHARERERLRKSPKKV